MQTDHSTTTFQRPGQPQSLQNNKKSIVAGFRNHTNCWEKRDTDFLTCLEQDRPSLPLLWLQYKPRADAGILKLCLIWKQM